MPGAPDGLNASQRRAVAELLRVAPVADELAARFAAAGHEIYLVGGSVRDALLGRLGNDLDFATDAEPAAVREIVAGFAEAIWDSGASFGTIGVQRAGYRLEITTYRSERYDPRSRKPVVDYGRELAADLGRRDFTVNAMAVALPFSGSGRFVDPYGGLAALGRRLLRTPGSPESSFDDDPLRMLRAARFAAQLGFSVDPPVVAAMRAMAERLAIVSVERIQAEFSKLLCAAKPRGGLTLLVDTGLAEYVVPELPRLQQLNDPLHRHKDVYEHSLTVLEQAIALEPDGPDLTLRLAALLHDVGKPKTRSFEPGGRVSFHHHEVVGRDLVRNRLTALRFPRQVVDDVARLVELHLRFHGYGDGQWTDSAVRRYVADAGPLLDRLHRLVRSDSTTRNRRKAAELARAYDEFEQRVRALQEREELARIRPDLNGHDVMAILGVPPGPVIKRALSYLLEVRMERGPLPREEAVAALLDWAAREGLTPPA